MSCCENTGRLNKSSSLIGASKSIIKHFTNSKYDAFTSKELKEFRLNICKNCEYIDEFLGKMQCKICKCFLEAKASLNDQTCPHPKNNKWEK